MSNDSGVRFLLDDDKKAANFIYRPPTSESPQVQNATLGVKFAQGVRFLDPWGFAIKFKTRKGRILFRLRHPIVYSKRGMRNIYQRVKRFFFGDPPMIKCIPRKEK